MLLESIRKKAVLTRYLSIPWSVVSELDQSEIDVLVEDRRNEEQAQHYIDQRLMSVLVAAFINANSAKGKRVKETDILPIPETIQKILDEEKRKRLEAIRRGDREWGIVEWANDDRNFKE